MSAQKQIGGDGLKNSYDDFDGVVVQDLFSSGLDRQALYTGSQQEKHQQTHKKTVKQNFSPI